jgi:SPP1 family predicted phage head-tail adaptor
MRAGDFDTLVSIQQKVVARDAYRAEVVSWIEFAKAWAKVEGLTVREQLIAEGRQAQRALKVKMRYLPGVLASMRVQFEGRTLEIINTLEIGRKEGLLLTCEEFGGAA